MNKALVVMSGGQDSTTCLGVAISKYGKENVEAICFNYGQKHSVEIVCASQICAKHKVVFKIVEVPLGQFNDSALIAGNTGNVNDKHPSNANLPASFVPARNATFLTLAHGYAQLIGANKLITGVCETDYSGYPDCRNEFIESLETTLNLGYQTNIQIFTPLMWLTKAETFALAEEHDFLPTVIDMSHTCYNGNHTDKFEWGYGCAECPACKLREEGYNKYIELFKPETKYLNSSPANKARLEESIQQYESE